MFERTKPRLMFRNIEVCFVDFRVISCGVSE